ncbi:MAG TPA: LPXTG cell wall anchor domain-containing protein [Acidimicrobiales bacterium]|nr:LPXTG cell wall anchor domain-containing protein [Acidimicrobiales bacterium]
MALTFRQAATGFGLVALMFFTATAAGAQTTTTVASGCAPGQAAAGSQYPVGRGQLTLSNTAAHSGDDVTASGCGFKPGSSVALDFLSTPVRVGTATADANGGIRATVTVPANATPGTHTIEATGTDPRGAPLVLSASITILGAGAPLPHTGSSSTAPLTAAGVGLVLIGGVAVVGARRRRARAHALA